MTGGQCSALFTSQVITSYVNDVWVKRRRRRRRRRWWRWW